MGLGYLSKKKGNANYYCKNRCVAVAGLLGGGGERRSPGVLDVFPAAPGLVNPDTSTQSSERGERRLNRTTRQLVIYLHSQ